MEGPNEGPLARTPCHAGGKTRVRTVPGHVILLLDACHSGALIENDHRSGDSPTEQLYRDLTSGEKGLVVMCSSRGVEVSKESNAHNSGLFTLALVEGLKGKARMSSEGAVYLKALDDYVTERVKVLSEGKHHPLTSKATTITNIPLTRP